MRKLLVGLFILSGCTAKYVALSKMVLPTTNTIAVRTVVEETWITIKDGHLDIETSTAAVKILGSGVFISPSGHILTCAHLFNVGVSSTITVETHNNHKYTAQLLYKDDEKDLALVKVDLQTKFAKLATKQAQIGQEVLAVGNPDGLKFSVTHGIISYINRDINEPYLYVQTDAPINPGNSGGPLFNTNGELIGINARKIGGADGLGFAISQDTIKDFLGLFKELP